MSRIIDLKPVSEEMSKLIEKEGSILWLVKLDSVIYGPFETENLKHYIHDNEFLYDAAEVSHLKDKAWFPFWKFSEFQRRNLSSPHNEVLSFQDDGPFWILEQGIKIGPLSFLEIDKKLEMGLLAYTDHISVNNGQNWLKIYELSKFDRRSKSSDQLPSIPDQENTKLKKEFTHEGKMRKSAIHELADITWQELKKEKTQKFNLEEILSYKKNHSIAFLVKWGIPSLSVVFISFLFLSFWSDGEHTEDILVEDLSSEQRLSKTTRDLKKGQPQQEQGLKAKNESTATKTSSRSAAGDSLSHPSAKISPLKTEIPRPRSIPPRAPRKKSTVSSSPPANPPPRQMGQGIIEPVIDSNLSASPEMLLDSDQDFSNDYPIDSGASQADYPMDFGMDSPDGSQNHVYQDAQNLPQENFSQDSFPVEASYPDDMSLPDEFPPEEISDF